MRFFTVMTFNEALIIAQKNSSIVGSYINGELVEEILIIPTNADELKMYMDKYLSNSNPQQSIAPFIYSDVKVVALFRKDLLLKSGIFLNIEIK